MTKSLIAQYIDETEALDCASKYPGEIVVVMDRAVAMVKYRFSNAQDKTMFLMKHPNMYWIAK